MSVHNGEAYLREAVDSVLGQTMPDFEFLVIDDGSTDGSPELLRSYGDPRIRFFACASRSGLAATLNRGFDLARGDYIARMDCDDVCLPERLARQAAFLDLNPGTGACGTWVELIGERAGEIWRYPTEPDVVRCGLLFESTLAHPSVMFRREMLLMASLRYDPAFPRAQDYEFWVRCSQRFPVANLGEVLLLYRRHAGQAGRHDAGGQRISANCVRLAQLRGLGIEPAEEELALHERLARWELEGSKRFVEDAGKWLMKLKAANDRCALYPEPSFSKVLGDRWFHVCHAATGLGPWAWKVFFNLPVAEAAELSLQKKLKFGARCGIRYSTSRSARK